MDKVRERLLAEQREQTKIAAQENS